MLLLLQSRPLTVAIATTSQKVRFKSRNESTYKVLVFNVVVVDNVVFVW